MDLHVGTFEGVPLGRDGYVLSSAETTPRRGRGAGPELSGARGRRAVPSRSASRRLHV